MQGHTECVRILAETGRVDWSKADKWGQTPLYLALYSGQSDMVKIIVQQPNIDFNVKTNRGVTLAQAAVWVGDVKCVETLAALESFDCWNVPDSVGNTPIISAVNGKKKSIIKLLLKCPRVDVNIKDKKGDSLYHLAQLAGKSYIVRLIEKRAVNNGVVKAEEMATIGELDKEKESLSVTFKRKKFDSDSLLRGTKEIKLASGVKGSKKKLTHLEISNIKKDIQGKREKIQDEMEKLKKEMEKLDQLEFQLEEDSQWGEFAEEYMEFEQKPMIKEEIKKEPGVKSEMEEMKPELEEEFMEQPRIKLEPKTEIKQEL